MLVYASHYVILLQNKFVRTLHSPVSNLLFAFLLLFNNCLLILKGCPGLESNDQTGWVGGLCEQKMTKPGFVMPKNKFIEGINSHCISRIADCGPQVWSLSTFFGFLFSKGSNQRDLLRGHKYLSITVHSCFKRKC